MNAPTVFTAEQLKAIVAQNPGKLPPRFSCDMLSHAAANAIIQQLSALEEPFTCVLAYPGRVEAWGRLKSGKADGV